ncbi:MAG: hypothetical protein ACKO96_01730 [Flammeovirgaceae bacterium]
MEMEDLGFFETCFDHQFLCKLQGKTEPRLNLGNTSPSAPFTADLWYTMILDSMFLDGTIALTLNTAVANISILSF